MAGAKCSRWRIRTWALLLTVVTGGRAADLFIGDSPRPDSGEGVIDATVRVGITHCGVAPFFSYCIFQRGETIALQLQSGLGGWMSRSRISTAKGIEQLLGASAGEHDLKRFPHVHDDWDRLGMMQEAAKRHAATSRIRAPGELVLGRRVSQSTLNFRVHSVVQRPHPVRRGVHGPGYYLSSRTAQPIRAATGSKTLQAL